MDANYYNPQILIESRESLGLSQQDVADRLNVVRETISRIENGKNASLELLSRLCLIYDKTLHDVIYKKPVSVAT